jgi:hypothetical protein
MSEWLKEHAWKAIPATLTEHHRNFLAQSNAAGYVTPMLLDATRSTSVFIDGSQPPTPFSQF